jgi:gliding motility-associated-like protein
MLDDGGIFDIQFEPVDTFDCASDAVTIDASASLSSTAGVDISWESLNGNSITPANGSLIVAVDGPGAYVLTLGFGAECTNSDTIFVEAGTDTPFADAGTDLEIECGEMPMLEAQNSTPPSTDTFLYNWTALGVGTLVSGQDGPNPIVTGVGVYALTITNLINLCESTDTVEVTLIGQEPAQLPFDFVNCSDSTSVTGNQPAGTFGAWELIQSGSATVDFLDDQAIITGLEESVTLVWTLSATGCENYSSDTITVSRALAPVAVDDNFAIIGNNGVGTIDLLDNDQQNGPVTIELLDSVPFGEIISFFNGELTYDAGQGASGSFELRYEICSESCGTCSEGVVQVRVDADGDRPPVYNAITPNGDRLNEFLVFDLLEFAPEEYPDNNIIIFNRWGDILYEAAPYNNDWDGRNQSGNELPEGTYYYIFRLSLGEGDIIRGDVTILR